MEMDVVRHIGPRCRGRQLLRRFNTVTATDRRYNPAAKMGRRPGRIGGMSEPIATRRRFRFGLRTLLAAVTLAAVGSWAYWFGWPWWLAYRERIQFERTARQLTVGSTMDDVFAHFTRRIEWQAMGLRRKLTQKITLISNITN